MSTGKIPHKGSNHFFVISFLPAIAYWYLEANYSIKIAVTGGILLAILEVSLEKIFFRKVHGLSKLNFYLIVGLGLISLAGEEGLWFKLQPFLTGFAMGGVLLFNLYRGKGLMWNMMVEFNRDMPPYGIWRKLERDMAIFLMCYGTFMGGVAIWWSTPRWLFF